MRAELSFGDLRPMRYCLVLISSEALCELYLVMAGLVPAIYVLVCGLSEEDVDARVKPGHDAENDEG